jgi:DNA-binding response OmpR family regulator
MKIKVYLIDDESTFRSQFKRAMKSAGFRSDEFEFHEFDTTDAAVQKFLTESGAGPRLALFDQNVKSSLYKGTEAIRKIRESGDDMSVLGIISSSGKPDEITAARAFGARFWIRKGGGRAAMIAKMSRFKSAIFDKLGDPATLPAWLEIGLE